MKMILLTFLLFSPNYDLLTIMFILELYFYYGTAAYYMGDNTNPFARDAQGFDYVSYEFQTADGKTGKSGYEAEEAYEKFNIRLISWEVSEPIQNTF